MKLNVGGFDRPARIILGLGLIALALFGGQVWGWVGVVPLLTGAIGLCPIYSLFGINTCSMKNKS